MFALITCYSMNVLYCIVVVCVLFVLCHVDCAYCALYYVAAFVFCSVADCLHAVPTAACCVLPTAVHVGVLCCDRIFVRRSAIRIGKWITLHVTNPNYDSIHHSVLRT